MSPYLNQLMKESRAMEVTLLTKEDLEAFRLRLLEDLKEIISKVEKPTPQRIKSAEVRKLLGDISPGKLHNLKVSGIVNPKKIGGTYYYDFNEIRKLLE